MSMNPEQLGAGMDFPSISQEKIEGEESGKVLVDLEQMMTGVFTGKFDKTINEMAQTPEETSLPVKLVANPSEVENPPEEEDRRIRNETGPSLRSVRIDAGSPTGQELPVYDVDTGEMTTEEPMATAKVDFDNLQPETEQKEETPTVVNEILEPVNEVEGVEPEKLIEENPVVAETVKEELIKEELIVEEDELSARRSARAQLEKIGDLSRINSQLLAALIKRNQFEQLENRNAA